MGGVVAVLAVATAGSAQAAPATTGLAPPGVYYDEGLQVSFTLEPDGDLVLLGDLNPCQGKGAVWASLGTADGAGSAGTYYGYYDDDPTDPCAPGSSPMAFRVTEAGLSYEVDGNTGTLVPTSVDVIGEPIEVIPSTAPAYVLADDQSDVKENKPSGPSLFSKEADVRWRVSSPKSVAHAISKIGPEMAQYAIANEWVCYPKGEPKVLTQVDPFYNKVAAGAGYIFQAERTFECGSIDAKIANPSDVVNALKGFVDEIYKAGRETFKLNKEDMKHVLERHHPRYWNGTVVSEQGFLNKKMTIGQVRNAIREVMKQNRSTLTQRGTTGSYNIQGTVNGQNYQLGVNSGRVRTFFPVK